MVWKGNYQDDWNNFEIFQKKLLKWLKLFWNFSKEIIKRISGGVERKHWCRSWRCSGGKQGRPFLISTCFAFFFTFLCFFSHNLDDFVHAWTILSPWMILPKFMMMFRSLWKFYITLNVVLVQNLNNFIYAFYRVSKPKFQMKKILWEEFSWIKGGGCGELFAPWQLWWPVCCQRSSTPVEVLWPHYSYNGLQSITLLN